MSKLFRPAESDRLAVNGFLLDQLRAEFAPWVDGIFGSGPAADQAGAADADHRRDPEEAALRNAYDRGFADGSVQAEEETRHTIEALGYIVSGLEQLRPCEGRDLAVLLATVIDAVLRDVLAVTEPDPALLQARIVAAAEAVVTVTQPAVLELNPLDAQALDTASLAMTVEINHALGRGEFRVLTASGGIEDGPELRLQQLKAALQHQGLGHA
jgi:flagellar assembly protein FliH